MEAWPAIDLIRYSRDELAGALHGMDGHRVAALSETGVPANFLRGRYRANQHLVAVEPGGEGHHLIWFGGSGLSGRICADPGSGEVVEVQDWPGATPSFVNSSLEQFTQIVQLITGRLPFHAKDAPFEEVSLVADEVGRIIAGVDSAAMMTGRYWSEFVEDLRMGDFSNEDLLSD